MCPAWESLSGHGYPECPGKATFPKRSALQSFALPDPGCGIERDVGALEAIVGGNGSKRRVDGVERQPRRRFAYLDVDHFDAGKREALGVRSQLD
jgi:hypothetical protein